MSPRWWSSGCALALLAASAAQAHIKLLQPTEWVVTSSTGDPQKLGPCGITPGFPGVVYVDGGTTVEAGSLLQVEWVETVQHPGHFRLAIAADRSALLDPAMSDPVGCYGAAVSSPPVAPVVADGLFTHAVPSPDGGRFVAALRVPDAPCERCTLQVLQFMEGHGAPCFYYHCAELRIVARAADGGSPGDAGTTDAGTADAGSSDAGATDAGTSDAGTSDAGTSDAGSTDAGSTDAGAIDAGTTPDPPEGPGCGCQGAGVAGLLPLLALLLARRGRRPT